eukprot:g40407.t1
MYRVNSQDLFPNVEEYKTRRCRFKVTKTIDESRAVDVVYMDFSKAFDKILHGRLILKVKSHGIHTELAWLWKTESRSGKLQAGSLQNNIAAKFDQLHQFLHQQEHSLRTKLQQKEKATLQKLEQNLDKISEQRIAIEQTVAETQKRLTLHEAEFLKVSIQPPFFCTPVNTDLTNPVSPHMLPLLPAVSILRSEMGVFSTIRNSSDTEAVTTMCSKYMVFWLVIG